MNLPQNIKELQFKKWCQEYSDLNEVSQWHSACCLLEVENQLFFIVRSQSMPVHPGQIGLIGGSKQEGEDPVATALREFKEETSFEFEGEVIGLLPPVLSSGGRVLVPIYLKFEGFRSEFESGLVSNGEWDHSFFIPIDDLSVESSWSFARFKMQRVRRIYFFAVHNYISGIDTMLWGATARIIFDYLRISKRLC